MKRRVVITGIGCVSPLGIGIEPFWDAIADGISGISAISRFDCSSFDVQLAGEIRDNVPYPVEFSDYVAEDIKIAFAINAAVQAMKSTGLTKFGNKCLLHLGTSLETFDLQKIIQNGKAQFDRIVDQTLAKGARHLQMPLDTPCELIESMYGSSCLKLTNVSACAASAQAIGHSFCRIRDGTFDMALCGGFDSMINPLGIGGFQILGALNTNTAQGKRSCRPFDSARSGTVLGEGAAMFVLEPMQDAVEAGKKIYAEILGYGTSLDACKLSAPDPDGYGGMLAMRRALDDACLDADDIHAVSTHGTGTYLNDEVEANAVRRILGDRWPGVPVISTKSLIGHLIGAAGAVELAACIQGFIQNRLHPNGSLNTVAKGCELDHVVGTSRKFEGKYILKNSFGFGGQNATLIIGKAKGVPK
ncbi:MAG: beta-ketoacyl-[acyl-carrier-protein] synthase family protein [Desulfobacterales bacterium]|nr:beta-ketoacyl-[acyl-carrier-protein] synthase family protein [Desulfobacterales bacterium]